MINITYKLLNLTKKIILQNDEKKGHLLKQM